jgi:hypothetical protein
MSPAGWCRRAAIAGLAVVAAMAVTGGAGAQVSPGAGEGQDPPGLPPASFPSSPHRGVIDGAGRIIPCRCRFNGKAYQLGEIVCMRTHVGTVLTRCDIFGNNTSWMPSRQPCEPDAGT